MPYEVEMKFPAADLAELESRLAGLGATIAAPQSEVDVYFAHPARDFAKTDEALRIRRKGSLNFITYKGPKIDAATKTRREIELPLSARRASRPSVDRPDRSVGVYACRRGPQVASQGPRRVARPQRRGFAGRSRRAGRLRRVGIDRRGRRPRRRPVEHPFARRRARAERQRAAELSRTAAGSLTRATSDSMLRRPRQVVADCLTSRLRLRTRH